MVKVAEVVGTFCVTSNDGKRVASQKIHEISENNTVEFNFDGVEIFSTSFFKGFYNCIQSEMDVREYVEFIVIKDISDLGKRIHDQVRKNFLDSLNSPQKSKNIDDFITAEVSSL